MDSCLANRQMMFTFSAILYALSNPPPVFACLFETFLAA